MNLKGTEIKTKTDRYTEIFCLLIYSPNAHHSQGCRLPCGLNHHYCRFRHTLAEAGTGARPDSNIHSNMGYGIWPSQTPLTATLNTCLVFNILENILYNLNLEQQNNVIASLQLFL